MHFIDKDLKFNFIVEETDFQPLFYILHPHKWLTSKQGFYVRSRRSQNV